MQNVILYLGNAKDEHCYWKKESLTISLKNVQQMTKRAVQIILSPEMVQGNALNVYLILFHYFVCGGNVF